MFNLIKLEWKKNHVTHYLFGVLICALSIFAAVGLMAVASNSSIEPMFTEYAEFMTLTNILIRIVYIIFSAVILSRLVIEEYRNNTIQIMFTYPLQRKKLMRAKLAIVFGFCLISILITTLVINIMVYSLNPVLGFFEQPVRLANMMDAAPSVLINACMVAGISLISLFFGMRKKSTAAAITSAVIVGFLINVTVSDGGSPVSLFQFIGVPISLCILGLAIGFLSYHRIDKKDLS